MATNQRFTTVQEFMQQTCPMLHHVRLIAPNVNQWPRYLGGYYVVANPVKGVTAEEAAQQLQQQASRHWCALQQPAMATDEHAAMVAWTWQPKLGVPVVVTVAIMPPDLDELPHRWDFCNNATMWRAELGRHLSTAVGNGILCVADHLAGMLHQGEGVPVATHSGSLAMPRGCIRAVVQAVAEGGEGIAAVTTSEQARKWIEARMGQVTIQLDAQLVGHAAAVTAHNLMRNMAAGCYPLQPYTEGMAHPAHPQLATDAPLAILRAWNNTARRGVVLALATKAKKRAFGIIDAAAVDAAASAAGVTLVCGPVLATHSTTRVANRGGVMVLVTNGWGDAGAFAAALGGMLAGEGACVVDVTLWAERMGERVGGYSVRHLLAELGQAVRVGVRLGGGVVQASSASPQHSSPTGQVQQLRPPPCSVQQPRVLIWLRTSRDESATTEATLQSQLAASLSAVLVSCVGVGVSVQVVTESCSVYKHNIGSRLALRELDVFLRGGQGGLVVVASLERLARRPEELEELRGRLLGARASLATVELFGRVAPAGLSFLTLPKDEQHAWGRDGSSYAQLLAEAEGNWEEARVVMPTYWATSDRQSLYTRVPHLASRATWAAAKSEVEGLNKLLGAVLDGAHAVPYIRTSGAPFGVSQCSVSGAAPTGASDDGGLKKQWELVSTLLDGHLGPVSQHTNTPISRVDIGEHPLLQLLNAVPDSSIFVASSSDRFSRQPGHLEQLSLGLEQSTWVLLAEVNVAAAIAGWDHQPTRPRGAQPPPTPAAACTWP